MARWTGATAPAGKASMLELMKKRESFGLLPGGFQEATLSKLGVDRVYINHRKGFIK
ncbi:unnamed protein product, partial [Discosporangium mesarthrocarpum]